VGSGVREQEESGVVAALDSFLEPFHRAADVGAGTGHYTSLLARRCASVVAVEPSPPMRQYLRERIRNERLSNVQLVAGRLPGPPVIDQEVDVVVCIGVLQYVPDLRAAVASLSGLVRPGGRVIFSVAPATRGALWYACQEHLGRRRVRLRSDAQILEATHGAGLAVESLTTRAGVTRVASTVRIAGAQLQRTGTDRSAATEPGTPHHSSLSRDAAGAGG